MGVDNVLMFVKSIDLKESMAIGIELDDNDGVQMASSRIGPKSKEYADDMMRNGRGHCRPQHGPRAAVKRG